MAVVAQYSFVSREIPETEPMTASRAGLKRFSMTWNGKPFLSTGNGVNGEVHGRTVLAGPA
jgi:hypothetical protein